MTITYLAGARISGLSTDTKPTLVPISSQFTETDTRKMFHWTGSSWIALKGGFGAKKDIMYKVGNTYYYERYDGSFITSSDTCETVLATAVTGGGTVSIMNGSYVLSPAFAGVDISDNKTLELDPNAQFSVPNGYTGHLFRIPGGREYINIRGGKLFEAGTPQKLWTAIKFESSGAAGIGHCAIHDAYILDAGTGIDLFTSGTEGSWINGNTFSNIFIKHTVTGIDFRHTSTGTGAGIYRNRFYSVHGQDSWDLHDTQYGLKNVQTKDNIFVGYLCWDMTISATQKIATISPNADNNIFIGGAVNRPGYFIDNSRTTIFIMDEFGPPLRHGNVAIGPSSFHAAGKRKMGVFNCSSTVSADGLMAGGMSVYAGAAVSTPAVSTNGWIQQTLLNCCN